MKHLSAKLWMSLILTVVVILCAFFVLYSQAQNRILDLRLEQRIESLSGMERLRQSLVDEFRQMEEEEARTRRLRTDLAAERQRTNPGTESALPAGRDEGERVSAFSVNNILGEIGEVYGGYLVYFTQDGNVLAASNADFWPEGTTYDSMKLSPPSDSRHPGIWYREEKQENGKTRTVPYYYVRLSRDDMQIFREESAMGFFFFRLEQYTEGAYHVDSLTRSMYVSAFLLLISLGLITWLISILRMIRNHPLNRDQYRRYQPGNIRRLTVIFGVLSVMAVFLLAFLTASIDTLRTELTESAAKLNRVTAEYDVLTKRSGNMREQKESAFLSNAAMVAEYLGETSASPDRETLRRISESFGSEYIMVFDEHGQETACSTEFLNYTLNSDETIGTGVFRRLTRGAEWEIAAPEKDDPTGKVLQKLGVRLPMGDRFGVVVFALDPALLQQEETESLDSTLLQAATSPHCFSFAVGKDGRILNASDPVMEGDSVSNYGITAEQLNGAAMCMTVVNGTRYYGTSVLHRDRVYFYFFSASMLEGNTWPFALCGAGFALALYTLLSLLLHAGYTRKNYKQTARISEDTIPGRSLDIITADGRIKRTVDPQNRWALPRLRWKGLLPEQRTGLVIRIMLLAFFLGCVLWLNVRPYPDSSIIRYMLAGNWKPGWNLFSIGRTVLMICIVAMALLVLRMFVHLICMSLGTKGETIVRLLFNLTEYIAFFTVLYYSFENFGLDTSALLGAMGFLSLAVSLGSKDIIADVLAGITIVFEGEYQVGDIVQINGYKGQVLEIGARSTKLMGQGDNINIIANRVINNVLNMTRFNSWYAIEVNISTTYSLPQLEELMQKELPLIGKRIPNIISGPKYKGIESFSKGSMKIIILAECLEANIRNVQRSLNREIRLLLDRENVPLI